MANETSFSFLLEDSFTEPDGGIEDYSIKIQEALKNLTENYNADSLQQALQHYLPLCPDNMLEENIFKETLPFAYRLLSHRFKQLEDLMNMNGVTVEDLKRQLLICQELLNVWEKSMERVSKFSKTPVIQLKCLIRESLLTVQLIFEHCKTSKNFYGTFFDNVSEELTNLFRKSKTILNLFLTTLEGVITFDTNTESETELLIKVVNSMGLFVTITHELDLKTFVETSKIFGKLAITYQHSVKGTDLASVISHLGQITRDISSMLSFCENQKNDRIEERKIKVIGHSLKILDRIFTIYYPHINSETLNFTMELLSRMHKCSPLCLQKGNFDDKLIESINIHIVRGIEPVLNTVFKTSDFKQTFFDYGNRTDIDKVGYHLLTISIMKKLITMPFEQNCKWTLGVHSIIDFAITNIVNLQEEIYVGKVRSPGIRDIGETSRSATLYEATLVPICALISQIPADGFHAIELILLKHLLSNQLLSSLMSSDIWCFIGRIGSTDLCANHVKYLLKLYSTLVKRNNSIEVVILENLIGRLYNLLSEETKHSLVTELDDLENPFWIPVSRFLPAKTKSFLHNRLACVLNEIPNVFADLQRQPTVQNWNRITTLLSLNGKLNHTDEKNTADILSQIWNSVANTIEIFDARQLDILSEFLSKLFGATQPGKIQEDTFFSILDGIITSFECFPNHIKVLASHYLRNNTDSFVNCGINVINALSELNCRLLEDENPWVRQEALESFDHVAHMCPNEDLVTKMAATVTKKVSLTESVPAYLSNLNYYELQGFSDVRFYLQNVAHHSVNLRHICTRYEDSQRDEKYAKFDTQSTESSDETSSSFDFNEHVMKICDELHGILKKSDHLTDQTLRRLQSICGKVWNSIEMK